MARPGLVADPRGEQIEDFTTDLTEEVINPFIESHPEVFGGGGQGQPTPPSPMDNFLSALSQRNPTFFEAGEDLRRQSDEARARLLGVDRGFESVLADNTGLQQLLPQFGGLGRQLSNIEREVAGQQGVADTRLRNVATSLGGLAPRLGGLASGLGNVSLGLGGLGGQLGQLGQQTQALGGLSQGLLGGRLSQADQLRALVGGGLGDVTSQLQGISQGVDPRFDALRQSQLAQLQSNQQQQQAQQDEFFGRRGLGGSSAALNAQNRLTGGFNQQRNALTANLGLQQLQRQDAALQNVAGLLGQRAGIESGLIGQGFGQNLQFLGQQQGLLGQQQNVVNQLQSLFGQQQGVLGQQAGLLGQEQGVLSAQQQNALARQQAIQSLLSQKQGLVQAQGANLGQRVGLGSGLLGQRAGVLGQRQALEAQRFGIGQAGIEGQLGAFTAGLENLTIPQQLQIAQTAAENAGKLPDQQSDSPGILGGILGALF